MARYNPDGSLDPSFGTDGKVTSDFFEREFASAVAIQGDGKIVAVGSADATGSFVFDFRLLRYNSDGTLDTSFGDGGAVTTDFSGLGDLI